MTLDISRHGALFDHHYFINHVWVFGVGGTGGETARCLIGDGIGHEHCPLHLCDPDYFQSHNVPSQLVSHSQADEQMMKVEAVRQNLLRTNPKAVIHTYPVEAPDDSLPTVSGVVFLCLDSMDARRKIIEELLENNPAVECVIDIRMDIPGAISFCFDPNDAFQVACYFDMWYDDDDETEMLGCNDEHFARRSSILGAVMLAMESFYDFAEHGHMQGIVNHRKLVYRFHPETEIWKQPGKY